MRRAVEVALVILLALAVALLSAWGALALWYRLPAPEPVRALAAGAFALLGLGVIALLFGAWRWPALLGFAAVFAMLLVWWSTIEPPAAADWAPDVARQVTGTLDGDMLTLTNVRAFAWRTGDEAEEHWETRRYDLAGLRTLDLFLSYWDGPQMAHLILSFGFEGGEQLAWSIEVRRSRGGAFSPIADLFKSNPLVIVAAEERDVVGVRSNLRGEDVQLYRLAVPPAAIRALLLEYVADANALAATPQFYNSLTSNCTTVVVKMMHAVGASVPFDWRLIVNGYLPGYAYDRGVLDTSLPLAELRARAHIDERARAGGLGPDFSQRIRAGVPSPSGVPAP
ncbi:Lnb N-terminal periplasmic domain-containing protein [Labrys wisconsinensis]|uniref:Lnb N-terminal periplasmic domain-containing protein n=1 Tax=Labrys wisconsinensis TaxID=425677 RepID=A0ABU0JBW8_9HYPH|nr:DUF4105 domain-containing protein [Labrys wisconsinensis]MDQ0471768.1 hypothetical protein [Labrys wisconsinensis]